MACVGKKIAKYTASNSLMVNNCAAFPKASPATSSSSTTLTPNATKLEHDTVQHQLTVTRAFNGVHHLAGASCASGALASCVQKRHRTTFSSRQLKVLEEAFEQNNYPCAAYREQIATRANLELSRVQVWFQNRRAKHKKQMNQAMRCFAAAAAAASSTASGQHQIHTQPFSYHQPDPQHPPPDFFQQNHHQSPGSATLQLTTPYNDSAFQQESSEAQHLNHLTHHNSMYLRQTNALSQQTLNFNDSNMPGQQMMLGNQSLQLRGQSESYLQLQMQQHQLQLEREQEQQDLSASSFGDTEGNFSHILNTNSIYSSSPKLNQIVQQTATNQQPPVVFSSSQAGAIDHSRGQPRQQAASQQTASSRDGLDYLY